MNAQPPDRFKVANAFWLGLPKIGLSVGAVRRESKLPVTLYDGEKNLVSAEQFFALWRAVFSLSQDPGVGLKLGTLNEQLEKKLTDRKAATRISDRVKWTLKRRLAGNRPDLISVAHELGLSSRTLQRKITEEGQSFRQLLLESRKELVHDYLRQSSIGIAEAAYLLGYDDPNSFFRAFRSWEGTTPAQWRAFQKSPPANRRALPSTS